MNGEINIEKCCICGDLILWHLIGNCSICNTDCFTLEEWIGLDI